MDLENQSSNGRSETFRLDPPNDKRLFKILRTIFDPVIGMRRRKAEMVGKLIPQHSAHGTQERQYLLECETRDVLLKFEPSMLDQVRSLEWDEIWVEGYFEHDPTVFVAEKISKAYDEAEVAARALSL